MQGVLRLLATGTCFAALVVPTLAAAHGPSGDRHAATGGHDEAAMKAQHERMGRFYRTMREISDAIIHGDIKAAESAAGELDRHIKGHEKDVPHKNAGRVKEFHGLYVDLERKTRSLGATLKRGDLSGAGVAYGRVLGACAACHRIFRD